MTVYKFIICLLLLEGTLAIIQTETVPVLFADYEKVLNVEFTQGNPFSRTQTRQFGEMVKRAAKLSDVFIIFVEENFSTEDLSFKDSLGTPYENFRNGLVNNQIRYFPAVISPYKFLTKYFSQLPYNVFHVKPQTKLQILDNLRYIYVYFKDNYGNETRIEVLRRHDLIINEVTSAIRRIKSGPIIALYTGKSNPNMVSKRFRLVKIRREKKPGVVVISAGAMFKFVDVFTATPFRRLYFRQRPLVAEETYTETGMATRLSYTDFDIEFKFSFTDEGWFVDNVTLSEAGEVVGITYLHLGAPWNWSYVCGEPIVVINHRDMSTVNIMQYQIQPRVRDFRSYASGLYKQLQNDSQALPRETATFGQALNCGPYFNITILSGLLVSSVILSIIMTGVTALMNCRANSKYDDPTGKPLTHDVLH